MNRSLFASLCRFPAWVRLGGFLACLGLVAWASNLATTGALELPWLSYFQNLAHAPLFGLLALSFLVMLGPDSPRRPWVRVLTLLLVLVAGFLDEWHQASVPGRGSDAKDLITDLLGGGVALGIAAWASRHPLDLRRGLLQLGSAAAVLLLWGWVAIEAPVVPLPFVLP